VRCHGYYETIITGRVFRPIILFERTIRVGRARVFFFVARQRLRKLHYRHGRVSLGTTNSFPVSFTQRIQNANANRASYILVLGRYILLNKISTIFIDETCRRNTHKYILRTANRLYCFRQGHFVTIKIYSDKKKRYPRNREK